MSLPSNINTVKIDDIKKRFNSEVDRLDTQYKTVTDKLNLTNNLSKMYNKAVFNGDRLYSTQLFTKQILSDKLSEQLDEMDTKQRMIQYTESDLLFNQNIVKTLYILMIGISIAVVIMMILYFSGFFSNLGSQPITSSSSIGNIFGYSNNTGLSTEPKTSGIGDYFGNLFGSDVKPSAPAIEPPTYKSTLFGGKKGK
jgi:hypothetical protein